VEKRAGGHPIPSGREMSNTIKEALTDALRTTFKLTFKFEELSQETLADGFSEMEEGTRKPVGYILMNPRGRALLQRWECYDASPPNVWGAPVFFSTDVGRKSVYLFTLELNSIIHMELEEEIPYLEEVSEKEAPHDDTFVEDPGTTFCCPHCGRSIRVSQG